MTEMNTILTQLQAASHAGTLKRYEKIGETKPYYAFQWELFLVSPRPIKIDWTCLPHSGKQVSLKHNI